MEKLFQMRLRKSMKNPTTKCSLKTQCLHLFACLFCFYPERVTLPLGEGALLPAIYLVSQKEVATFHTSPSPLKPGSSHFLQSTLVFLTQELYSGLRYSSVAQYMLSMHEVLSSLPSTEIKLAYAFNFYPPMPKHLKHYMAEIGSHLKRHANQLFYCRS